MLVLEAQRAQSQVEWLSAEREMILRAQLEGENIDPLYQAADLYQADIDRRKLEEKIQRYKLEWDAYIT